VRCFGPIALLAVYSLAQSWFWPALLPARWSGRAWVYVSSADSGVAAAVGVSLTIAVVVSILALLVSVPAARALAWYEFRGKRLLLFLLLLPVLAPPLAAAMGCMGSFCDTGWLRLSWRDPGASDSRGSLRDFDVGREFSRLDPDLEAQARTLGASRLAVLRLCHVSGDRPGDGGGGGVRVFDFVEPVLMTVLIGGGRVLTLPLALVAFQRGGDEAITAALSLVFLFLRWRVCGCVAYLRYET